MIGYTEAVLHAVALHRVGNPVREEPLLLCDALLQLGAGEVQDYLLRYCLAPFSKVHEQYCFDLPEENPVFGYASAVFADPDSLLEVSQEAASHLYRITDHPAIKEGELYLMYFSQLLVNGTESPALGIFKSESKEPYLAVRRHDQHFDLAAEPEGINLQRLDKGCLILPSVPEGGYRVLVLDQTNRQTAHFWTDRFLRLRVVNDEYQQTQALMGAYREFVTSEIAEQYQMEKADQIELLNRSMHYFKEKDHFDLDEFSKEVIGNEQGAALFREYKQEYERERDLPAVESFDIHPAAVKKQSRVYKSVLKLDRNFHIYVHGNREYIEKGFDQEKNLHFYKVYFREEQ